jgi:Ca2+/H+ antiporter, TMEM165/GDT1 family
MHPHGRAAQVFVGALAALVVMTVLSALLGWAAPALISVRYTRYGAILLFIFFGLRSLYDGVMSKPVMQPRRG